MSVISPNTSLPRMRESRDVAKLTPLLRLKYHDSLADAVAELGNPAEIGQVFRGFQRYLYVEAAASTSGLQV